MTLPGRKRKGAAGGPDYEIGYGKPTKATQFRPGRSGNPNGRPKGTLNLKTDLTKELSERVRVTENGRSISLSKQRLLLKALAAKAIKGDTRAAGILLNLVAQTLGFDPEDSRKESLSSTDAALLDEFLAFAQASTRKREPTDD
jgi:hypothetical protein